MDKEKTQGTAATEQDIIGKGSMAPGGGVAPTDAIQISSSLGKVFVLPEAEQIELLTLEYDIEQSLKKGWTAFVEIGEALIKIKKANLYRGHGEVFEEYCAARWGFHHSHANELMGAARFVKGLESVPQAPKPERESIVRPLLKLPPDKAQSVWIRAAELAKGKTITARLVKAVVREQNPANTTRAELRQKRAETVSRRAQITKAFGELMKLVGERADYALLSEKLEALYTQCQCLLSGAGKKRR